MYQVIARKYRPQSFAELIGQDHVKTTVENAISQRRIAHGYIFSGQRGTGKTTVARILARCLNCIEGPTAHPCGVCASCKEVGGGNSPDVIEIDAASNRGINEMRELRENVRYRPARDRYKVFIVDEAHQITNDAFNALLKTLEEPPEWAVFVLCTTEAHKLPTTIVSRCQQFSFRSVDFAEVVGRMEWIATQEGIEADAETLAVLAQAGEGSVRDSLSALDQAIACCGSKLNAAEVRGLLGMFSLDSLALVSQALSEQDSLRMLDVVMELERNGRNLQHFCRELARYFRNLLVVKVAGSNTRLIAATPAEQERLSSIAASFSEDDLTRYLQITLDVFKDLQTSLQPRLHLEIGLLKLVHAGRLTTIEEALAGVGRSSEPPKPAPRQAAPLVGLPPTTHRPPSSAPQPTTHNPQPSGTFQTRLHDTLVTLGLQFAADTVAASEVTEANGELRFLIPDDCLLYPDDINKAVASMGLRQMKVSIVKGTPQAVAAPPSQSKPATDGEAEERALSHPEVKRFREAFPDAHVRAVRNLKE
jgi:DNA polymerase-3 subunit gamma/tau